MNILAITDIPRMTALFERLAQQHPGLAVVSEIHRGIDQLESRQPDVVIIQNHLAGLSADILHKHLKSRLGRRKVRFALISTSDALDIELSTRFEVILDPAQSDGQLEQAMQVLFHQQEYPQRQQASLVQPDLTALQPATTEVPPQPPKPEPRLLAEPVDTPADTDGEQSSAPITYELPRRPGISINSDFSRQLDTSADDLKPHPAPFAHQEQELRIRDLHRAPHLIAEFDAAPQPWYRRAGVLLVITTMIVVVVVSVYQHLASQSSKQTAPVSDKKPPQVSTAPVPAIMVPESSKNTTNQPLASHGTGRPRVLPSFIPKEGLDKNYGKDNPGWESYRGQTNEYRVFREKDGTIKAIQVVDRSGAGIQESFYTTVLKELAGVTAMRPTASEIKEGYEIRRGEVAGLQLVQYRDAQGGRMRGFVITWP